MSSINRQALGWQGGQSLVEFVLVLPLLLLLFSGGADLARAYFVGIQVADGARQASVYASGNAPVLASSGYVSGSGYTTTQLQDIAKNNAGGGLLGFLGCPSSDIKVKFNPPKPPPNPAGPPYYQSVTVVCSLTMLTPLIPSPAHISSTAEVYVVPQT